MTMQRTQTNRLRTPARAPAEMRARELGYDNLTAMLEAAYAADRPWTEVAQELDVCKVDTVSKWARKLGMRRGEGWFQQHEHRDQLIEPVGKARLEPTSTQRPPASREETISAALQRAAQRAPTPSSSGSASTSAGAPSVAR
jgi:hypothetical protein